ncbi:hypothetical protein NKG05_13875 [Oerskovia sp. M15]
MVTTPRHQDLRGGRPGKSASQTFSARAQTLAAGTTTVVATRADGSTSTDTHTFEATTC